MKITTKNAKILVLGTPAQTKRWITKWGSKVSGVDFIPVSKEKHFKSRHRKNTRVLILSDPKKLQEKIGDKINRLNPIIQPEAFEAQIEASEKQATQRENAIGWFRETSMGEKVEIPSE